MEAQLNTSSDVELPDLESLGLRRVLVTGCSGFIGARLSILLLEAGLEVVGVDVLNAAYDIRLKQWRMAMQRRHEEFTFHKLDLVDDNALDVVFTNQAPGRNTPFDAVFHLAAKAGVRQSVEDPKAYYHANVLGTLSVLDACRRHGVNKAVLASTSSVYGRVKVEDPFSEDMETDHPLSPYAASKKASENLAFTYHWLHDIDVSVLRFFTVYGPSGRPDMSIFRFVRWIVEKQPVVIYGDGYQSRSFTYVDDVVAGTIAATARVGYEILNLGSNEATSLIEVVNIIEDITGCKAEIEFRRPLPADMRQTLADVKKANQLLGWRPTVEMKQGVEKVVDWYMANRDWASQLTL